MRARGGCCGAARKQCLPQARAGYKSHLHREQPARNKKQRDQLENWPNRSEQRSKFQYSRLWSNVPRMLMVTHPSLKATVQ